MTTSTHTRSDRTATACGCSPLPGDAVEVADVSTFEDLARAAQALADPIRLGMLDLMTQGRGCCGFADPADRGVPGDGEPDGICVCEFQERFGLAQSKASYHLRVLRDAGLVSEETRGKWSFYAVESGRVAQVLRGLCGVVNARLQCFD
jgi:ArsR family transcriptional regulator